MSRAEPCLSFESLTFNDLQIPMTLFWTESARLSAFRKTFSRIPENFPVLFSRKVLRAVCQIHRLKYADTMGLTLPTGSALHCSPDWSTREIMTCGPSYHAFLLPSILTCPYLGLNTTHISWSKKLVHAQIKRGRIVVSNHYRWFEIRVYGSREYDAKPYLVRLTPLSPTLYIVFTGCPEIGANYVLPTSTSCPEANCHVGLLREVKDEGTAASATRHQTENMPPAAQLSNFCLTCVAGHFRQDEAIAHSSHRHPQRWCQLNFHEFYRRAYDRETA